MKRINRNPGLTRTMSFWFAACLLLAVMPCVAQVATDKSDENNMCIETESGGPTPRMMCDEVAQGLECLRVSVDIGDSARDMKGLKEGVVSAIEHKLAHLGILKSADDTEAQPCPVVLLFEIAATEIGSAIEDDWGYRVHARLEWSGSVKKDNQPGTCEWWRDAWGRTKGKNIEKHIMEDSSEIADDLANAILQESERPAPSKAVADNKTDSN